MKVKSKDLKSASYQVVCTNGDYEISASVNIGSDEVKNMDNGAVTKKGEFVASFGEYGGQLNVNFATIALAEKSSVLSMIETFKSPVIA